MRELNSGGHAGVCDEMATGRRRLQLVIVANALMRVSGSASGILVGLYLSDAANRGASADVTLAGILGAVSFGAELVGSIPLGMLSDAVAPRGLMALGALLGAAATQLFGLTGSRAVFFFSRSLEGLGAAASGPALLAHLTDMTDGLPALRARVMSFFELSFLAGLALGGVAGAQLWRALHAGAFASVAFSYVLCAGMLYFGATGSGGYGRTEAMSGFWRAVRDPYLRGLAPVWLCVNTIAGLWLGPALTFLLTQRTRGGQYLTGIFADQPQRVGWLMLWYTLVFGVGITAWSVVLPRMKAERVLRIGLIAMLGVCLGLFCLNHSGNDRDAARWTIGALTGLCVMVESGFTPAALALLAGSLGARAGRGAAMGIYAVLLSLGAIAGSLLAAGLGKALQVDGLICGTLGLAVVALALLRRLPQVQAAV